MDAQQVSRNASYVLSFILSVIVVCKLNPAVKDFFMNEFIVFSILLFVMYQSNQDLLVSFAGAFVATVVIAILTMDDPYKKIAETFGLIKPDTDAAVKFHELKMKDLVEKAGGEEKLKEKMMKAGVPHNVALVDENAPLMATYFEAAGLM